MNVEHLRISGSIASIECSQFVTQVIALCESDQTASWILLPQGVSPEDRELGIL